VSERTSLSRREWLISAAALAGAAVVGQPLGNGTLMPEQFHPVNPVNPVQPFVFDEITIAELQRGMSSGSLTARGIVSTYTKRINEKNESLRAVIELNPHAGPIGDGLDAERKAGKIRGPLHGIPVLIKDNIATLDAMQTTAGSLALVGSKTPRDAFIVERLRAAGAVILGKTNLSEWANFRSSASTSGWSGRGGQCRNPYALDRTPSGSSSGTGVAIAANLCAIGVGTETDGSIVSPASRCSLVGIKPTVGLVSRSGIIPISHSQDTAGPMARTVTDAAILLGALTGVDERDPATAASAGHAFTDYTKFLDPKGLAGARIGIPRPHYFGYSAHADELVNAAIELMRSAGAIIVDPAPIATAREIDDPEFEVLLYEFKADLNAYLGDLGPGANVRTLADLIAWNAAHRTTEMPFFGQDLFEKSQAKGPLTDQAYLDALAKSRRLARAEGIDATMDKYQLDALVAPTNDPPTPIDLVNGDCGGGGSCSTPAAVAGYPHITVPAGYSFGLPSGISFFGRAWSEPLLIKFAFAYEQASKMRRPPTFPTTAEI